MKGEEALAGPESFEVEAIGWGGSTSRSGEAPAEYEVERDREDARREARGGEREPILTSPEKGQPSGLTITGGDLVRRRFGEALTFEKYFEEVAEDS